MTREDLKRAWEEYQEKGFTTVDSGVFLEMGKDIPDNTDEYGNPVGEPLIEDACYLTTDDGSDPVYIMDFEDLCYEMRDNLED